MKAFFVFSGQGAQAVGMGQDLYNTNSAAKEIFELADSCLDWSVSEVCFNGPAEKLTASRYCQPAIYTMSCAALEAFRAQYPQVEAIGNAGLSLGEYAALYASGVVSFTDGLKLVAQRAELMDKACQDTDGGMASVLGGDKDIISAVCRECDIDVANFNSPGQIVISGEKSRVKEAITKLKEQGIKKVIPLRVAGAYHSRLMTEAGQQLRPILEATPMKEPLIPVYQNFSGKAVTDVATIIDNLEAQVAGSVQWVDCVNNMIAAGGDTMFEFGPGNVLTGLLRRTAKGIKFFNINSAAALADISLS